MILNYIYPQPLYDVALWHFWPTARLPLVAYIEAASPLLAALTLMKQHKLTYVGHAAVASPDHSIKRWPTGLQLETLSLPDDEDEESEVSA
jgi:hypothetical protein